jgi:hypothetical protein
MHRRFGVWDWLQQARELCRVWEKDAGIGAGAAAYNGSRVLNSIGAGAAPYNHWCGGRSTLRLWLARGWSRREGSLCGETLMGTEDMNVAPWPRGGESPPLISQPGLGYSPKSAEGRFRAVVPPQSAG